MGPSRLLPAIVLYECARVQSCRQRVSRAWSGALRPLHTKCILKILSLAFNILGVEDAFQRNHKQVLLKYKSQRRDFVYEYTHTPPCVYSLWLALRAPFLSRVLVTNKPSPRCAAVRGRGLLPFPLSRHGPPQPALPSAPLGTPGCRLGPLLLWHTLNREIKG